MNDNENNSKITSEQVINKQFNVSNSSGYDPEDVDSFLDSVVNTLKFYEDNFARYQTTLNNFASVRERADSQDILIKKLEQEIKELYENGYNNKAMMLRVQNLEKDIQDRNNIINERWNKIEKVLIAIANKLNII